MYGGVTNHSGPPYYTFEPSSCSSIGVGGSGSFPCHDPEKIFDFFVALKNLQFPPPHTMLMVPSRRPQS